jgi:hypothetical protein
MHGQHMVQQVRNHHVESCHKFLVEATCSNRASQKGQILNQSHHSVLQLCL